MTCNGIVAYVVAPDILAGVLTGELYVAVLDSRPDINLMLTCFVVGDRVGCSLERHWVDGDCVLHREILSPLVDAPWQELARLLTRHVNSLAGRLQGS